MAIKKADNKCRSLRTRLYTAMNKHIGSQANWARNHIANCPRCQRRLASAGKVHLALSFTKAQPHGLDLLMRANEQAVSVLKHSLRREPKAQALKEKMPEPKPLEKYRKYGFSIGSLAACLAILILMKIEVFSSMDTVHSKGRNVFKQYYVRNVGQDLADEVFPGQIKSSTDPKDTETA